jgi:heterodisulfide reductase subunit A-like polyferredoxin
MWEYIYDKLLFKKSLKVENKGLPVFVNSYSGQVCCDCLVCVDLCPEDALSISKGKLTLDLMRCSACEYCLTVCSDEYLTLQPYVEHIIPSTNRFKVIEAIGEKESGCDCDKV